MELDWLACWRISKVVVVRSEFGFDLEFALNYDHVLDFNLEFDLDSVFKL